MNGILFIVSDHRGEFHAHVLVNANDREKAKRRAHSALRGNPDNYIVNPLTRPGEAVSIDLSL